MLAIEPTTAVRFPAGKFSRHSDRLLSHPGSFFVPWNKVGRLSENCCRKSGSFGRSRIRASADEVSGPVKQPKPQRYHPSEDVSDSEWDENGEAILKPAETCRTIIEVNSKAMLMFSGLVSDEVHENIFWPDLPYVTDEHGSIYFQVKNDEDILQTLTSEDNLVQVIIGLDTTEMISEMELLGQSEADFGIEGIDDEDSDDEDDEDSDDDDDDEDNDGGNYEKDWVSILEDEEDREDSDGSLGDWAKLETMRSSHPMHFAKQLAEFVSDDPVNYMEQPPAGLAIQGLLRPAFVEESSVINKHMVDHQFEDTGVNQITEGKEEDMGVINGHRHKLGSSQDRPSVEEEMHKDQTLGNGTSYYKLEMIKIQLITAQGRQTYVEVEDFRRARPDAIAHSAAKIISRLKAGGEKTTHALKSICWRCKGIQVEEVALIGVDSLGFDLRVCSGREVQTLRFSFKKRASSEYSAERQLNCLLFPRINGKQQTKIEATSPNCD